MVGSCQLIKPYCKFYYLSIDNSYSDDALNKAENLAESFMDFTCLVEFYLEQEKIDKSKVADYCLKAEKLAESFSDFTDLAQFYCHEGYRPRRQSFRPQPAFLKIELLVEPYRRLH